MTSTELTIIAPLDAPLPPVPEGDVLTPSQWDTLLAIADTIVPALEVSSVPSLKSLSVQPSDYTTAVRTIQNNIPANASADAAQKYLAETASSAPGFKDLFHRILGNYMREDALKGIRVILSALE